MRHVVPNWVFITAAKRHENKPQASTNEEQNSQNDIVPYVVGLSGKFRRIFSKHNVLVHFRPSNTLRQRLANTKDKIPKYSAVGKAHTHIGETKQPLHRRMASHRTASTSGHDLAVHLHLKEKGDSNVQVLHRGNRLRDE